MEPAILHAHDATTSKMSYGIVSQRQVRTIKLAKGSKICSPTIAFTGFSNRDSDLMTRFCGFFYGRLGDGI